MKYNRNDFYRRRSTIPEIIGKVAMFIVFAFAIFKIGECIYIICTRVPPVQ